MPELPRVFERLAEAFDLPVDSPAHRDLAENGWVAGDFVTVRYWLGCLLSRNLFRVGDDEVATAMQGWLADQGYVAAQLGCDRESWPILCVVLRWRLERSRDVKPSRARLGAALDALLRNPDLSDEALAGIAMTTPNQIVRMTDVAYLRIRWKRCRSSDQK